MKCLEAGDMRTLLTIERATKASDGQGGTTETWAEDPPGGVWGNWRAMSGREAFEGQRDVPHTLAKVTIWFRGDANSAPYYTADDRVKLHGRTYSIQSVIDPDDRQRVLEMEVVSSRGD